jgi:hypothetical protein
MSMRRMARSVVVLIAAATLCASQAAADESHYVLIFGAQSHPKLGRKTHTWATFVRAEGEGPDPRAHAIQVHTISWLPRTLEVRPHAHHPEPGVNLDLDQSFAAVLAKGEGVMMWGPIPISKDMYQRSLYVRSALEGGVTLYKAISPGGDLQVVDCNQSLQAIGPDFGLGTYPRQGLGFHAGQFFARQVAASSPDPQPLTDTSWLVPRLGIDRYPVTIVPAQHIFQDRCVID